MLWILRSLLYHSSFLSFHYCDADTMRAWTIQFNFVTETEHISDKCLLSEWRLLDDLHVCNGPLKICLFCLLEKSGRNIPNKGVMVTLEENHICLCGKQHVTWYNTFVEVHIWCIEWNLLIGRHGHIYFINIEIDMIEKRWTQVWDWLSSFLDIPS